ncbi:hypothetical protein Ahy_B05g075660 isoform C [Arachis hypogaea]|uniref:Uncharacterized protein n=1 Tax=Arachis hypogaea TaxID=3818 RepID=A0A444Z1N8_ARAHY|nr:hypothetical protein Ahy_B05g075660 isoform C [Arachis hypogaea]
MAKAKLKLLNPNSLNQSPTIEATKKYATASPRRHRIPHRVAHRRAPFCVFAEVASSVVAVARLSCYPPRKRKRPHRVSVIADLAFSVFGYSPVSRPPSLAFLLADLAFSVLIVGSGQLVQPVIHRLN